MMRFAMPIFLTGTLTFTLALACSEETPPSNPAQGYGTPFRTDAELVEQLTAACRLSVERTQPMLVEFSAAWCSDCQRLQEMKRDPALAIELRRWPNITVNVGRFDRHRSTLDALGIESIAHWAVFSPFDCEEPIATWQRVADRTLEVSSGEARNLSPADLATWLRQFRTS